MNYRQANVNIANRKIDFSLNNNQMMNPPFYPNTSRKNNINLMQTFNMPINLIPNTVNSRNRVDE
jgi:hypothetical protein